MHTRDALVRVSSSAWNRGGAWQALPDWQARGSTGTVTKVTTDPWELTGEGHSLTVVSAASGNGPLVAALVPSSRGGVPMGVTSAYSHSSRSFRGSASGKVAVPAATGAVASCGGNGTQPRGAEDLPGPEVVQSLVIFATPEHGTIVIRRMSRPAVQEAHKI